MYKTHRKSAYRTTLKLDLLGFRHAQNAFATLAFGNEAHTIQLSSWEHPFMRLKKFLNAYEV